MTNPLLDFSGLPRFGAFKPDLVGPAVDHLLAENRALVDQLVASPEAPTWPSFVEPLQDANERLGRAWGQVGHMNGVMNSPELREAYNANLPKITQYWTELAQNQGLYAKYKQLAASAEFPTLARARRKTLENALRDFRLGGAELSTGDKASFMALQEKLAATQSRFSDNLLDATNAFAHFVTDEAVLAGIPEDARTAAREAAAKDGREGWKFTLHMPSYLPVMQYADDRALRELMYRAYATRAAEFGKPEWDNTPLISEILELRAEEARLLGYANFAQCSLEPKMARTPAEVLAFLREVAAKAKPHAHRDLEELSAFARDALGLATLEAWDLPYASEKLRLARYSFSDQEVKQYLPETTVLPGMFRLVEEIYGITLRPATAELWHPDVRFYEILDRDGAPIGQFYVDLYARASKRGGAWMDDAMGRRRRGTGVQLPVAYLTCNFSAPVGGKPALFTHDEVITLFHEFGHGLHHLLTRIEDIGVSGINGVEWDAVELPSQFMENFCWEWAVFEPMTRHAETGERMPRALFDKMLAAKNFQSGMQTVRQIEFSLYDMLLHCEFDPSGSAAPQSVLDAVRREVAVFIPPAFNRFANSFSHIFAGGYAAGYYSYKWAEVLSADAYSLFEERGVLNPEIGARFRDEILGVGGSRPAMESFVAFRGREPKIDALLRHNGMATA